MYFIRVNKKKILFEKKKIGKICHNYDKSVNNSKLKIYYKDYL